MDVKIRIIGGTGDDLVALGKWLTDEDELRGRVGFVRRPIGETELGLAAEALTIALGAGGAGTVLASSLKTWLTTRQTRAKITVESADRSVTVDIATVGDIAPVLAQILTVSNDD
jgi:Effector Associated Constant Component 1